MKPGADNIISDPETGQTDGTYLMKPDAYGNFQKAPLYGADVCQINGQNVNIWDGNHGNVMCGQQKCSDEVMNGSVLKGECTNPFLHPSPAHCPEHFGWGPYGETNAICFGNQESSTPQTQAQGARKTVKSGQRINTPYTMAANHRGTIMWILAKAECGDHNKCFDPDQGATVLEFDDDCTLPTVQNKYRMVELIGITDDQSLHGIKELHEAYQNSIFFQENPEIGKKSLFPSNWYFGTDESPYGAEYVRIPDDIAPGDYTLMMKLKKETKPPNLCFRANIYIFLVQKC